MFDMLIFIHGRNLKFVKYVLKSEDEFDVYTYRQLANLYNFTKIFIVKQNTIFFYQNIFLNKKCTLKTLPIFSQYNNNNNE